MKGLLDASPEVLEEFARLKRLEEATKTVTGTPTTNWAHGPTGIFSGYGLEQGVFHTRVKPTGLLEVLPAYPTAFTDPLFAYITGFQADTGSDPAGPCNDCQQAGIKKACHQTAQFGRYCRETQEIDFDRVGKLLNRMEATDLRLLNPIFEGNRLTPQLTRQEILRNEIAQKIVELGISLENLLSRQVWIGNPANNNVGGGYAEFPGLAILVGTGKVDALTNTSCPSLDSDVKNFNYQDVCASPQSIVQNITYMLRYVSENARKMQMDPVDLRFVMRETLFYEISACWPCAYMVDRCNAQLQPPAGQTGFIRGEVGAVEAIRMRDAMRNGKYLTVDGKNIPVIFDDGIDEESSVDTGQLADGEFASDIYLLPFSVRGNVSTLYMEYYDYRRSAGAMASGPGAMIMGTDYMVTDNGMFSWTKSRQNWCFLWLCKIEPRIILRTPHLAGRLQNVKYVPLQHTREPFPDYGYFVDGGITTLTKQTHYAEWGTS